MTDAAYGICGYPLNQSLSPLVHGKAMQRAGLPGSFAAWETPPEALPGFVRTVRARRITGVSVTIPHKERIIPLLDGITETAAAAGAVNTLYWDDCRLMGHNTDVEGFLAPLRQRPATGDPLPLPDPGHAAALVLGAGGAARAVVLALLRLGLSGIHVAARDSGKADALLRDIRPKAAGSALRVTEWAHRDAADAFPPAETLLLVNTTPLGMRGKAEGESPYPAAALQGAVGLRRIAYDIVYNPLRTRFLADAAKAGWTCVDGLGMFVAQAAAQFHLWTNREFPLAEARDLAERALAARA